MSLIFGLILSTFGVGASAQSSTWTVKKSSWQESDEKKFSEFIQTMGDSGCRSLDKCLKSPKSNPFYASKTPKYTDYLADCADLPFALRMYFAWMEGLPFDYVSQVDPAPENGNVSDIRYTKYGNLPKARRAFTPGNSYNGPEEMRNMINAVSTAMYRMHYKYKLDFYPTMLDRKSIAPGTILYDASGHAAIVYRIEKNGLVRMMDAHPDQSISRIVFSKKFSRSRIAHGAGFRNWRPELSTAATDKLPRFSTIQFSKTFELNGTPLDYYDYVRAQMAGGNLKFDPVAEVSGLMTELCSNVQERVHSVQAAIRVGIHKKSHPQKLPSNIYGTYGEWEDYSTPSRDARLKTAFLELKEEAERYIEMYRSGNSRVQYTPVSSAYSANCSPQDKTCYLVASLLDEYDKVASKSVCQFTYTNSVGQPHSLDINQITSRLFKLSFDPYHCIELRWGADGQEKNSCPDRGDKLDWYEAEQGLRNQLERTYDAFMGYDLQETRRKLGVSTPPDVNLRGLLERSL
tara:strand:+ start:3589 stop:5139 length:1551 start_codon:yes stop_codon:yes gene_type:complete